MSVSKIEKLICDKEFSYLQPYFYNNKYALRCELGIGDTDQEYMKNAKERAIRIYDVLFPRGADAIIFNYWINDYSDCGCAEKDSLAEDGDVEEMIAYEIEQLKFLLKYQSEYRHVAVKDLETYDAPDDEDHVNVRRNRIVCFSDGIGFDHVDLIDRQINGSGHEIGFVSFQNECILSVYDDRGCDVVFAAQEKMKEFYPVLRPYFLEYDIEEMKRRFEGV